jgi:glycosyltransferase involved in cell wall biosynthesis
MKLSIIIPTLNEEKFIGPLLDTIKMQDFKDYEVIVSDAGSKDRTVEIAKSYGCTVVKGGVLTVGRNNGAAAARGDLFLFLDSDARFLHSKFLSNALAEFKKRKLDVCGFRLVPYGGKPIDKLANFLWSALARVTQSFLPHASGSILIKKEIHKAIHGFDEEIIFVEDHPYVREAGKIAKFGFIWGEPVSVSMRRYEKDGRFNVYVKYILAGFHMIFIGPIKTDIFKYKFAHYEKQNDTKK